SSVTFQLRRADVLQKKLPCIAVGAVRGAECAHISIGALCCSIWVASGFYRCPPQRIHILLSRLLLRSQQTLSCFRDALPLWFFSFPPAVMTSAFQLESQAYNDAIFRQENN